MQGLFQLDAGGDESLDGVFDLARQDAVCPAGEEVTRRAAALVRATWSQRRELDELIQSVSRHWDLARMPGVDRAILRLACHELLAEGDASDAVVINEAIELAKEFGAAESPSFVNGILDAISRQRGTRRTNGR